MKLMLKMTDLAGRKFDSKLTVENKKIMPSQALMLKRLNFLIGILISYFLLKNG